MKQSSARLSANLICVLIFAIFGLGWKAPTSAEQSLRHYIFDQAKIPQTEVASLGAENDPLRLFAGQLPETKEGRKSGNRSFVLDGQAYQANPFDAAKGFTIEVVFRYFGQGSELGNGRPNGMIFAQGDGYWHGLRLYCDTASGQLRFEMGRPQPQSAYAITSPLAIPKGVWQHVAVSWDGQQLRLYWNGVLTAAAAYAGPYTAPNGPLRIGFADAGIGSLRLQVAEWAAYPTSLPPHVIAGHALSAVPGPIVIRDASRQSNVWAERWTSATEAAAGGNWREAEKQWLALGEDKSAPMGVQGLAKFAAAVAKKQRSATGQALQTWARLAQDASAPELVRLNSGAMCVIKRRGVIWAAPSPELYETLLPSADWSSEERQTLLLAAAEAALQNGEPATARRHFEEALKLTNLPEDLLWDVKLRVAHCLRAEKQWEAARTAYRKIADDSQAPASLRSLALLGWASTYERAGQWAEAAQAYRQIGDLSILHPIHRWEAEELAREMDRLAQGLPRRDANWHRTPAPVLPQAGLELHVARNGDDRNPGRADSPLASLEGARDRIREIKKKGALPPGGVTVWVHGGVYPVARTLELTEEDSGTAESPIVYRAVENETPIFSGGVTLSGFQPVRDANVLNRLPKEVRGKVVQVDLRANHVEDFGSLGPRGFGRAGYPTHPWVDVYFNDQPGTLARWPNEGFLNIKGLTTGAGDAKRNQPGTWLVEGRPLTWDSNNEIWMYGYWRYLWAGTMIRVATIDRTSGRVTTAAGSNYGFAEGMPYYFFNVLEELDQPGEWYLDRNTGILYCYPPGDISQLQVTISVLSAPFIRMKNISFVRLVKLTFASGRAEGVVIDGGSDVALLGCRILRLGTNGVVILGGTKHMVMGCDIGSVGAGGVRLAGGDEKALTPSGHVVENCHIWDFTRVDRNYAPAVHVDGVGSIIRHNLFHDSPHHGMRLEGFQHLVELNEVHSVVYESDDQSGIDMFGNPASRGNILRWNFWHHIGSGHNVAGQAGIRLDDMISGVTVYGNVFYRSAGGQFGGLQIHGGKDNWADNNLFIACKASVSFSPWSQTRWLESVRTWLENARRRGLDVSQPPLSERYPELLHLEENANRNFILRSLVISCGEFAIRDPGVNVFFDNHAAEGDVGFVDPYRRQFGLKPDATVFEWFPFRPIPFEEIGPYPSPERATWPIEHGVSPHYVAE
ncbi:MAG: LamG-like jellyroll fold domain-containing protein [Thermogutta sp.]